MPAAARGVEVLGAAGREVVDDGDLVALVEQGVDEVRSDEAGTAGDEGAHRPRDGTRRHADRTAAHAALARDPYVAMTTARSGWIAVLAAAATTLTLALGASAGATDRPGYDVPPGFVRCPSAQALGGFFKWASAQRTTCDAAAAFMRAYGARQTATGTMPRRLRGYRCRIRWWRNADGDVYASRHACRRGAAGIRFYGAA